MGCSSNIEKAQKNALYECDTNHAKPIPESINEKLCNSIVKIKLENNGFGTGFFMVIEINKKSMECLFTCYHVISDNIISEKQIITLTYGKKGQERKNAIVLDKDKRNIITFIKEDLTMIEIIEEDNVSKEKYLNPDLNYIYGYDRYIDNNFYLAGYPYDFDERCVSSGKIIKKDKDDEIKNFYQFAHTLHTKPGSSGSPICNEKCDVVGMHTSGNESKKKIMEYLLGK